MNSSDSPAGASRVDEASTFDSQQPRSVGAGIDFTDPNSPLAPLYLQTQHVVAIAILGLIFLVTAMYFRLWYSDIWGHIAFGRWVVEHRTLPRVEPFEKIDVEKPEAPPMYWLAQVGFFELYRLGERLGGLHPIAGGVEILRLSLALLVLARMIFLLIALRRRTNSLPLASLGIVLILFLNATNIEVIRPQVVGELFFSIMLVSISRPVPTRRSVILVPLVFAFWANCHGSFVVGLAFLALESVACFLDDPRFWGNTRLHRLSLIFILGIAGTFLNPDGPRLVGEILAVGKSQNVLSMSEWQPIYFTIGVGWSSILLISLALAIATHWKSPEGLSWGDLLLIVVFAAAFCMQIRMAIWYSMVLPWVLARSWGRIRAIQPSSLSKSESIPSFRKTVLAGILTIAIFMWTPLVQWVKSGEPTPASLNMALDSRTPWQIAEQLKPQKPDGQSPFPAAQAILGKNYPNGKFEGMILASPTMGDYLVFHLTPDVPVSCYTHAHLFSTNLWQEWGSVFNASSGWWEILDRRRVNLIVIESGAFPKLQEAIESDPGWTVIHTGGKVENYGYFAGWIAIRVRPD